MNCQQAQVEFDAFASGELAASLAGEVERHLSDCATCSAEVQGIQVLLARLREAPPSQRPLPEGLARSVLQSEGRRRRPKRRRALRRHSRPASWTPFLAAAAALLLVGTAWLVLDRGRAPKVATRNAPGDSAQTPNEPDTPAESPKEPDPPQETPGAHDPPQETPHAHDPPQETPGNPDAPETPGAHDPPQETPHAHDPPQETPGKPDSPEPPGEPDTTQGHAEVAIAWVEEGQIEAGGRADAQEVKLGDRVRAGKSGARLRIGNGGCLLLAGKAEAILDGGLALVRGEAVLDLRFCKAQVSIVLGQAKGVLAAGGRCLLEANRGGRGRIAVLDGTSSLSGREINAGRSTRVRSGRVSAPTRWRAALPRWATRLRPRGEVLVSLANDLAAGLWTVGTVERQGARSVIALAPIDDRYAGVAARRKPMEIFRTGGQIEVVVTLKVEERTRVRLQFFDLTRQDNYQWHLVVEPGAVRRFRTLLTDLVAADRSNTPLRDDHSIGGIGVFAGDPGQTPRVVVEDLVVRRLLPK